MRSRRLRPLGALAALLLCAACDRCGSSDRKRLMDVRPGATLTDRLLVWVDASPDFGPAPLQVSFKPLVEGGAGELRYTWSFGDGAPDSHDAAPSHTFAAPGAYRVALHVTSAAGEADADAIHVLVR